MYNCFNKKYNTVNTAKLNLILGSVVEHGSQMGEQETRLSSFSSYLNYLISYAANFSNYSGDELTTKDRVQPMS